MFWYIKCVILKLCNPHPNFKISSLIMFIFFSGKKAIQFHNLPNHPHSKKTHQNAAHKVYNQEYATFKIRNCLSFLKYYFPILVWSEQDDTTDTGKMWNLYHQSNAKVYKPIKKNCIVLVSYKRRCVILISNMCRTLKQ